MSNVRTTLALVPEGKSSVMKFNKLDEHLTEWINSAASVLGTTEVYTVWTLHIVTPLAAETYIVVIVLTSVTPSVNAVSVTPIPGAVGGLSWTDGSRIGAG